MTQPGIYALFLLICIPFERMRLSSLYRSYWKIHKCTFGKKITVKNIKLCRLFLKSGIDTIASRYFAVRLITAYAEFWITAVTLCASLLSKVWSIWSPIGRIGNLLLCIILVSFDILGDFVACAYYDYKAYKLKKEQRKGYF